jgi:2-polyprenyl-3-methyl-5-hydroxy-6-metoxy-1,4-benzoquinol methylase
MREFTDKYTNSGRFGNILLDRYFRSIEELINHIPKEDLAGRKVLEVGCGAGFSTKRILNLLPPNVKIFASDYEEENVKDAKRRLGEDAVINKENIYNLKRNPNSMSLIFVLEVLEHLQDPSEALKEIKRVGEKYFLFSVPREPIWRILRVLQGKYLKDFGNTPGHIQHWSKSSFMNFLEENEFQVVRSYTPFPWILVLAKKSINR